MASRNARRSRAPPSAPASAPPQRRRVAGHPGRAERGRGHRDDHDRRPAWLSDQRPEAGAVRDLAEARRTATPKPRPASTPSRSTRPGPARSGRRRPARGRPARSPGQRDERCRARPAAAGPLAGRRRRPRTGDHRGADAGDRGDDAHPARRRARGRGTPCRSRCRCRRAAPQARSAAVGSPGIEQRQHRAAPAAPPTPASSGDRPTALRALAEDAADEVGEAVRRGAEQRQEDRDHESDHARRSRRPSRRAAGGELDQDAERRAPRSAALVDGQAPSAPTRTALGERRPRPGSRPAAPTTGTTKKPTTAHRARRPRACWSGRRP